jgi:hypothetical protein
LRSILDAPAARGYYADMTSDHLEAILKNAHAKADKEGWQTLPEGGTLTLYASHDGVGLTVSRVEAVRQESDVVYARTTKRELFAVVRGDLFAVAVDAAASGQPVRRAGFG